MAADDEGLDPSAIASDKDKLDIKFILADDFDSRDVCCRLLVGVETMVIDL